MSGGDEVDEVAAVVQRLAVLLAAGVAPGSALGHLAAAGGSGRGAARRRRLLRAVAEEAARGGDVSVALLRGRPASRRAPRAAGRRLARGLVARGPGRGKPPDASIGGTTKRRSGPIDAEEEAAWAALAACWRVATDSGAPVAAALNELAESLRELARARRDIEVALAGPSATGRVVSVLPVVALGLGALLGFDVLGVLVGTIPGLVCLVGGLGLMAAAHGWTRRLVRGASTGDAAPGLALDLLAVALAGGGSIDSARHRVLEALTECGIGAGEQALAGGEAVLALSLAAGVPAGRLLRNEAALTRARAASVARERAARLGVTLMLPLGVCVLPAFLLLGVAPMVVSVLLSTFSVAM
ncbi:pilus assembly protein TadB [Rathayibacter iranicus]|uniref:Tight adherence protein B n=1 Tax=Rathayibacter iranicus NCPPB 2253 = VKM Ac-1602 TaxID=1328868 RepID=A0ABX5LL34_9MICO|nr:pilus assembly protein TadB [Rathayibacter iranicus]MWV29876.1 pilus assembly protein TadB [Rathayibacter iranicus NCPPB 2253 = VKM Ac-1602]PPI51634.1 pilus assembly protein TadB [Rathayibacter iranicus]PPI63802.1 pilus assembly protein TadB [Rathayibacter iranicus]PPI74648.1 pilus assembly protein TadB [Rathayibacter iranicus]PWJ66966.1 tight adherence protein B [Rathayibacter iranicus] [Rathayibacter iranicus NCPPB 2253 = VKM Ac-1602]